MKRYAGIGSRQTPWMLRPLFHRIAARLEAEGRCLLSGGAERADEWTEAGVRDPANKRIYLPVQGFRGNPSPLFIGAPDMLHEREAFDLAARFHPAWSRLGAFGRACMARNSYQVLGDDVQTPVDCVVCWTADGGPIGGTGQALRIADAYSIPIFNLYYADAPKKLAAFALGKAA